MLKIVCNLQKTNVECFLLLDSKPGIGLDFLLIQHFVRVSYPWAIFPLVYIHFNCSITWDLIRTHFLPLENWWTTFNYKEQWKITFSNNSAILSLVIKCLHRWRRISTKVSENTFITFWVQFLQKLLVMKITFGTKIIVRSLEIKAFCCKMSYLLKRNLMIEHCYCYKQDCILSNKFFLELKAIENQNLHQNFHCN